MEALDPFQARIERSLSLTAPILSNFLRQMQASLGGDTESTLSIDLTRELRGRHFKLIQLLLKNPLQELLSSEVPRLVGTKPSSQPYASNVLFSSKCDLKSF